MRYKLLEQFYQGTEYREKLTSRVNTLKMCEADPLAIDRLILSSWAVDPIAFIEQFGWVKIPEYGDSLKPFFLFDYQEKIIQKVQDSELSHEDHELLVDKPRGMGLTWIMVWYMVWRFLFTPQWTGFVLSRTETEVDDGTDTPDNSIFGKVRWAISMLPDFIYPQGFTPKGKKGTSTDQILRLTNPQMSSAIIGSSTNSNAGRSRRYSFILIDECFSIEGFNAVYRALQSVARVKMFMSTVKQGRVYQDFKNMVELAGDYISLSWKDNPFKDQLWYEEQLKKAEFDPEVMKEIEVDYSVNIKSQYYPEIRDAKMIPDVQYNRKLPLFISFDSGQQDLTVIVWWQFDGAFFTAIECFASSRKPWDWYVPFMNPEKTYVAAMYLPKQIAVLNRVRTWSKPKAWFGEAAHFKAESDNLSLAQRLYKGGGIRLLMNNYAVQYEPRRKATSLLLKRTIFNSSSDGVMDLYDGIANSRYASSIKATSRDTILKPVHDVGTADYRSAAENFYVNVGRVIRGQREDIHTELKGNNFIGDIVKYLRV